MELSVHWTRATQKQVNVPVNHPLKGVAVINAKMVHSISSAVIYLAAKIVAVISVARSMDSATKCLDNVNVIRELMDALVPIH